LNYQNYHDRQPELISRSLDTAVTFHRQAAPCDQRPPSSSPVLYLQMQTSARRVTAQYHMEHELCVRSMRTVREQFVVEIGSGRELDDLVQLNSLFTAWVEKVYHRRVHSETGQTPLQRWSAIGTPVLASPAQLREAFLWSEWRTVKTATVSPHDNTYEVDTALVGGRVELVFDPFDLTRLEVRWHSRAMGVAVPHRIGRHVHRKARPDNTAPLPAPTGIDYLRLGDC
jgi:putative transposase